MKDWQFGRAEINQYDGSVELPDEAIPIGFEQDASDEDGWTKDWLLYVQPIHHA